MPRQALRVACFALVCLTLILAGIEAGPVPNPAPPHAHTPRPTPALPRSSPRLDPRPFLCAFLRYEVGERSQVLRRRLRATTTTGFATQLLAAAARSPATNRPSARIARLRVTYLSDRPPRALVAGTAVRAARPEQFSFLFEASRGTWLASGPAE
jgi:hypothetical protein